MYINILQDFSKFIFIYLQRFPELHSRYHLRLGHSALDIAYAPVADVADFRKPFTAQLFLLPAITHKQSFRLNLLEKFLHIDKPPKRPFLLPDFTNFPKKLSNRIICTLEQSKFCQYAQASKTCRNYRKYRKLCTVEYLFSRQTPTGSYFGRTIISAN